MEMTPQERTAINAVIEAGQVMKNGAPKLHALNQQLQLDLTARDRDRLWEAYQVEAQEPDAPEPEPEAEPVTPEPEPEPAPVKQAAPRQYAGPVMWIGPTIQTGLYLRANQTFVSGAHLPRAILDFIAKRPGLACLLVPTPKYLQKKAELARPDSDLARAWAEASKL